MGFVYDVQGRDPFRDSVLGPDLVVCLCPVWDLFESWVPLSVGVTPIVILLSVPVSDPGVSWSTEE